jgi:hypothetical protein
VAVLRAPDDAHEAGRQRTRVRSPSSCSYIAFFEEHRLVEQLLSVSRRVDAKYELTYKLLIALGAGTALCLAGVIVYAVFLHA